MNAEVLGVSVDKPEANRAWAGKINLPFRLLSDVEPLGKVGKEFGVWDATRSLEDEGRAALEAPRGVPDAELFAHLAQGLDVGQESDRQIDLPGPRPVEIGRASR